MNNVCTYIYRPAVEKVTFDSVGISALQSFPFITYGFGLCLLVQRRVARTMVGPRTRFGKVFTTDFRLQNIIYIYVHTRDNAIAPINVIAVQVNGSCREDPEINSVTIDHVHWFATITIIYF